MVIGCFELQKRIEYPPSLGVVRSDLIGNGAQLARVFDLLEGFA